MPPEVAGAGGQGGMPCKPAPRERAQCPGTTSTARAPDAPRLSPLVLGLVLVTHLVVFAGLMALRADPVPTPATPLMVKVMRSAAAEKTRPVMAPPKPETAPPKPKRAPRPAPARPVVQAPVQAPVLAAESPPSLPAAEVARPVPAAVPLAPDPATEAPAKQAAPVAVAPTAPRFDADYLSNPAPAYPPLSRRAGEEGRVVLRVFVEPSGVAGKVEVGTSSGFTLLDNAAVRAVSRWKFIPARLGAEPVGAWVLVPVNFKLKA